MSEEKKPEPMWIDDLPRCGAPKCCKWDARTSCPHPIYLRNGNALCGPAIREMKAERDALKDGYPEVHDGDCEGDAPGLVCLNCEQARFARWEREHQDEMEKLQAIVDKLKKACEATLMFHSAEPWDSVKRPDWYNLTQSIEATTKVLCDFTRDAQAAAGKDV